MKKLIAPLAFAALALSGCNKASDNGASSAAPSAPVTAVAPPAGGDWTATVAETKDGGFVMGNPNAAVKLIEYGSLSCPHCGHFAKESHDELHADIASGKISYELRTFIIHPQDYALSLLARCNGAPPFFIIADQMFAHQVDMEKKAAAITPADQAKWQKMTPVAAQEDLADKMGIIGLVSQLGISADKAKTCMEDKALMAKVQGITDNGTKTFNITGTPTFILNGQVVPDVVAWEQLKPILKKAGV